MQRTFHFCELYRFKSYATNIDLTELLSQDRETGKSHFCPKEKDQQKEEVEKISYRMIRIPCSDRRPSTDEFIARDMYDTAMCIFKRWVVDVLLQVVLKKATEGDYMKLYLLFLKAVNNNNMLEVGV